MNVDNFNARRRACVQLPQCVQNLTNVIFLAYRCFAGIFFELDFLNAIGLFVNCKCYLFDRMALMEIALENVSQLSMLFLLVL